MPNQNYRYAPQILREFLFYMLTIKGRSERTVHAYYNDLLLFMKFIKFLKQDMPKDTEITDISIDDIDIEFVKKITLFDIYEFMNYLSMDRDNNSATRARKVSTVRTYFGYLTVKANMLEVNPTKGLDSPTIKKSLPKYLTLEEALELLNVVEGEFASRDYCILTLFLNCGMRLSELIGINVSDIKDDNVRILGKGNKERIVYLNEACSNALSAYLAQRKTYKIKDIAKNALFISKRGTRLSGRMVEVLVEKYLKLAGLSGRGLSVHKLRHTAATLMYQHGGVDIRVLKEVLGHASVSTTEIYTHVSNDQMKSAMSSLPLSGVKRKKRSSDI